VKQVRERLLEEVRQNLSRTITDKIFTQGKVTIKKRDFVNKLQKAVSNEPGVNVKLDFGIELIDDWWVALFSQLNKGFRSKNYDVDVSGTDKSDRYIIRYAGTAGNTTAVQVNVINAIKRKVRNAARLAEGTIASQIINSHVAAEGAGEQDFPTNPRMSQERVEEVIRTRDEAGADRAVAGGAAGAAGTKVEQRIRKAIVDTFNDKSFVYQQELEIVHDWVDAFFGYNADLKVDLNEYKLNSHLVVQHTLKPDDNLNKGVLDAAIKRRFEKQLSGLGIAKLYFNLIRKGKLVNIMEFFRNSPRLDNKVKAIGKKIVIDNLFPHKTNPNMKLKVNKKLYADAKKTKTTGKSRNKGSQKKKLQKIAGTVIAATRANSRKKKKGTTSHTAQSPIALRNLLNEALPEMVASKMTAPALRFRTGRFANSARVENITIGSRGGTHIDYTYMRDPYETFEPGNKQGSTTRDPRKIIGASIRELATSILGRQPTTLRRN
tara:strand:- start:15 stop:1487 length:1473 start_codon:yes stop_codon:yes gene_type:complete